MTANGLHLLLFVKGCAHGWCFDYSISGQRKLLSLGTYPTTGLAVACKKADDDRRLVAERGPDLIGKDLVRGDSAPHHPEPHPRV